MLYIVDIVIAYLIALSVLHNAGVAFMHAIISSASLLTYLVNLIDFLILSDPSLWSVC